MTQEEAATITDFPLTDEIKELGISRVYTCGPDTNNETLLFVERTGMESNPLRCKYDKSNFRNTAIELGLVTYYFWTRCQNYKEIHRSFS